MINFSETIPDFRAHVPAARSSAYLITASTGLVPDFIYDGARRYMDGRYLKGGDASWEFQDATVGTLEMMERSKTALGAMLGCGASRIAFGQSATQMFTMVTEAVDYPPGANVVVPAEGWIGSRFAWQKREREGLEVRYAKPSGGVISAEDLMALCDENTAAISVNLVESETGYRVDIDKLGAFCRARGILLFADAVQAAGVLHIDMDAQGIDFLVGNDYKWMMNFCGTGYACVGARIMPLVRRWGAGWMSDTERFNTAKSALELRGDAGRFEIGYPNVPGIYGLGLAAAQYLKLGARAIEDYVLSLAAYCLDRASGTQYVRPALELPRSRRSQIVRLELDSRLQLRTEDFARAGVTVQEFGKAGPDGTHSVRLAFHYYNNRADIDRFFSVIDEAAQRKGG